VYQQNVVVLTKQDSVAVFTSTCALSF